MRKADAAFAAATARQTCRTESLRMCTRHADRFNEKDSNGERANIRHVYKKFKYIQEIVMFTRDLFCKQKSMFIIFAFRQKKVDKQEIKIIHNHTA